MAASAGRPESPIISSLLRPWDPRCHLAISRMPAMHNSCADFFCGHALAAGCATWQYLRPWRPSPPSVLPVPNSPHHRQSGLMTRVAEPASPHCLSRRHLCFAVLRPPFISAVWKHLRLCPNSTPVRPGATATWRPVVSPHVLTRVHLDIAVLRPALDLSMWRHLASPPDLHV